MAATTGILCRVKVSGDATAFTDEATSTTDDTVYQISDAAKAVWDRASAITVKNDDVEIDPDGADPFTVNRIAGKIIFETSDNTRVITVSGDYLPISELAEGHDFSFECAATNGDETVFGDTDVMRTQLMRDCSGSVGRFASVDTYLFDAFDAGVPVVFEMTVNGTPRFRAWALLTKGTQQGDRKSFQEESGSFEGTADIDGRSHSFLTV